MTGRFYLGDTHVHSTASDGDLSPAEIALTAMNKGLDFCAITDHHSTRGSAQAQAHVAATGQPLTVVTGQEVQCEGHVHFVMLGVGLSLVETKLAHLAGLADYVHSQGGAVILAHPWTAFSKSPGIMEQIDWLFTMGKIDALEVFTSSLKLAKFELWFKMMEHYGREWALARPGVVASSDWHNRNHGLSLGMGQTYAAVNTLSEGSVVEAVKAGRTVAAVSKSLAQESSLYRRLQETLFRFGEGYECPRWRENLFGPPDLVNELVALRREAEARLLASRRDGPPDAITRAAAAALAAGNYSRALDLLNRKG